jgi:hypothetical protein
VTGFVSLLPHRNDWTEQERDAVRVIEHAVHRRGFHRRGDVVEVPLTLSYIQGLLRVTGARRSGRDYARTVLATLARLDLVADTGRVLTPRKQPRGESQYWWRLFRVLPISRALAQHTPQGAYPSRQPPAGSPLKGSLRRFLHCQGLIRKRRKARKGSVQWVFQNSGPP